MKFNFYAKKIPIPFILILAAAFIIRIIYPNMFIADSDVAGHIFASLRPFRTSLFDFNPPIQNFFFQAFQFRHGFTVLLFPFLFYLFFFKILGLAISEPMLVFICSLWGILSITAIFLFVKKLLGEKSALFSALLIAFLPVHIGLSRVYAGSQIISILFLYLSLYLLLRVAERPTWKDRIAYFFSLAIYIGADNAFFIGLFFNLALIMAKSENIKTFLANSKRIYFNKLSLIPILPLVLYAAATIISVKAGLNSGYLLRLFDKVDNGAGTNFKFIFFDVLRIMLQWGGAILPVLIAALFFWKKKINKNILFIFLIFISYTFIFSVSNAWQDAYIIYSLIPACILISYLLAEGKKTILIYILVAANLFYSLGVLYNFNIFFKPISVFGSINREIKNNDYGGKSLAYLIREGKLKASKIIVSGKGGMQKERYGLLSYDSSITYYLAAESENVLNSQADAENFSKYRDFLIAVSEIGDSNKNYSLEKYIKDNNFNLIAEIYDFASRKRMMSIYANYKTEVIDRYDSNVLNPLYNKKYENLNGLSRVFMGFF
jgi:hypothetical protein